ncbi:MAG: FlgD immunoglobulin-like domain containing protein [bacterium]
MAKKRFLFIVVIMLLIPFAIFSGNITAVSGITYSPASPVLGGTLQVNWDYTIDSKFNNPHYEIIISTSSTLRDAGSVGQWVVIDETCASPASPATAYVRGGCALGPGIPIGTPASSAVFNLPADLIPGVLYYVIVGMRDYNCYLQPGVQVSAQNYATFTLPLPAAAASITKTVEGTNTAAGYNIMYTINYSVVNTNSFVITDPLPPEVDFLKAYNGGTLVGSDVVFNLGSITAPVKGSVTWMGTVKAGVLDGTVITNQASYSSTELGTVAGNSVTMTTGPNTLFNVTKTAMPSTVNVGDTITYTMSITNDGYTAEDYTAFDAAADITNWTQEVPGGTWTVGGGILTGTTSMGTWPKLIKNTPALHDGIFTADMYVPAINGPGDAVLVFNFIDAQNMYHARFQADAHQICFDRVAGGTWTQLLCVNDASIVYDTWFTMKVEVRGNNFKLKVWKRGNVEPATWPINLNDNTASLAVPGRIGFQTNEVEDRFDNLKIFGPGPAMNSRVYDTLPNCTTYVGCDTCTYDTINKIVRWDFPGRLDNVQTNRSFWVTADACASGTSIHNTSSIDSDESQPPKLSNDATVVVIGASPTNTPVITNTSTNTPTNTYTYTNTNTSTNTASPTQTSTNTFTPTVTRTMTSTSTNTVTDTSTMTVTQTITPTLTLTPPALVLTPITNYPNPFPDTTHIVFYISVASEVSIRFYTISGEFVGSTTKVACPAGKNEILWNGLNKDGKKLASGVYIYKIKASSGDAEQKALSRLAILR